MDQGATISLGEGGESYLRTVKGTFDGGLKFMGEDFRERAILKMGYLVDKISESPLIKPTRKLGHGGRTINVVRNESWGMIPMTALYFSLFMLCFLVFSRRVWSHRRRTRIYYGDGTSELSYALGSQQMMEAYAKSGKTREEEDTTEAKERAWRIENIRKLVIRVEARDTLLSNAIISVLSLLSLEISNFTHGFLHYVGMAHLLASLLHCEYGIIRPSTRMQNAALTAQWSVIAITSTVLMARMFNLY